MKNVIFLLIVLFSLSANGLAFNATKMDSLELLKEYSLFNEYHKNKDYESAIPFGWNVLKNDPARFSKWIYYKMEDAIWYLRDSVETTDEQKKMFTDTMLYVYDLALKYFPDGAPYFQLRKAFIIQTWAANPVASMAEYEKAFEMDPAANTYWYNQLAQIYKSLAADDPEFKSKAIDMFTFLSEREPDNPVWNTELESLVENIDELIDLAKRSWDFNKEDLAKAWKYASLCLKVNEFQRALEPLEFLVQKSPETVNYWNQLASAYHKLDMLDKAADGYRKLIELDPNAKEHYLNLGLVFKERNQLAAARTQFLKASEVAGGWGLAIFYEGLLYEQAARSCGFEFMDKCVYQLAVDTYRRAASMDPALSQARDRVSALSSSVPTQEDYFLRNYRKGQTIAITGNCYGWIGKSITVP